MYLEVVLSVRSINQNVGAALLLIAFVALGACDRLRHKSPSAVKAETKRRQTACASSAAYDRLKNEIFDDAIANGAVDRSNLDTLADYSVARMENQWLGSVAGYHPMQRSLHPRSAARGRTGLRRRAPAESRHRIHGASQCGRRWYGLS